MVTPAPARERESLALAALYAALFAVTGISLPFLPVWLDGRGLGPGLVGGLLALPILVRILATAPLTGLLDRGVPARVLVVVASLVQVVTFALMPFLGAAWPLLALAIVVNAVAQAPLVATADYLTLDLVRRVPHLAYARIRLAGSVSFLAASLLAGWWLSGRSDGDGVLGLLAGMTLCGAAVGCALPGRSVPRPAPRVARTAGLQAPKRPSWSLSLGIAAAAMGQASHAALYAFGSIHWRSLGVSSEMIGVFWAIGVVAEIGVFLAAGALPRWRDDPVALLALGTGAGLVRWPALAFAGDAPGAILIVQMLHGITFGATQLGAMAAVARFARRDARGAAQGWLGTCVALASAAATLASGMAFRAGGGGDALLLMAPLSAIGLACALGMREAVRRAPPC